MGKAPRPTTPIDTPNLTKYLKATTGYSGGSIAEIINLLQRGMSTRTTLDSPYLKDVAHAERSDVHVYWDKDRIAVVVNSGKPYLLPKDSIISDSEAKQFTKAPGKYGGQKLPEQREETMHYRLMMHLRDKGFKVDSKFTVEMTAGGGFVVKKMFPDMRVGAFEEPERVVVELKADANLHTMMTASGQAGLAKFVTGHPTAICIPNGSRRVVPDKLIGFCKQLKISIVEESEAFTWITNALAEQKAIRTGAKAAPIVGRYWITEFSETIEAGHRSKDNSFASPLMIETTKLIANRIGFTEPPKTYSELCSEYAKRNRLRPERVEEEIRKKLESMATTIFVRDLMKVASGQSDARKYVLKKRGWFEVEGDHVHVERWIEEDAYRLGFGIKSVLDYRKDHYKAEELMFTIHCGAKNRHVKLSLAQLLSGETGLEEFTGFGKGSPEEAQQKAPSTYEPCPVAPQDLPNPSTSTQVYFEDEAPRACKGR